MVKQESQRRERSALLAGEVARVLDRRAEAGRADHRAVAAGEAALGDVVPARMLEIGEEQVVDAVGVASSRPMLAAVVRDDRLGGGDVGVAPRVALRELGEDRARRARCRPRRGRGGSPSSTSSVSARSKPACAFGPVSIETQKQVPPASPQLTATMKAPSRRAW